jgi:hypothetical protein
MRHPLLLSLAFAMQATVGTASGAPAAGDCDKYLGVWEYIEPSAPGRVVVARHGDKYTAIWVTTAGAAAAEMSCAGARATFQILYSMNSAASGTSFTTEAEPERDGVLKWWGIGADGKRGDSGAARRVK